jgi:hypothetical protein
MAYVDTLLRYEGVPALKSFLDSRVRQSAELLTQQVQALLERRKELAVVWVVPEFNLDDWTDLISSPPHLPGTGDRTWRELDERIHLALGESAFGRVEALARQMSDLDGGTSSVPLRVLAECRRTAGDLQAARRYLELCRDAEGWDPSCSYSPRVSSSIQSALREAASARSRVVDLPKVLEQYDGQALPNRRLFLDYCHLTSEALKVAVGAIAAEALAALTGRTVPPSTLRARCPTPSAKIEGKASFLAAVHNAHFYQSGELVQYWCARALQLWPESIQLMTRLLDAQTRRIPKLACRSTLELLELDELGTSQYLLRSGAQRLELVLGEAIATVARQSSAQIQDFVALRLSEHSLSSGPKELTHFYYSSAIPALAKRGWMTCSLADNGGSRAMYASAYWEASKFIFFSEGGKAVDVKLTCRLPASDVSGAAIELAINGHPLLRAPIDTQWQTLRMSIPGERIVDGMNEIAITWPIDTAGSQAALARMADELMARQLPRFHRVFGEIHSLVVSAASTADQ